MTKDLTLDTELHWECVSVLALVIDDPDCMLILDFTVAVAASTFGQGLSGFSMSGFLRLLVHWIFGGAKKFKKTVFIKRHIKTTKKLIHSIMMNVK